MIIALIGCALIIVGMILIVIDSKCYNIGYRLFVAKVITTIVGVMTMVFVVGFSLENAINYDVDYQDMLHKKEMLEYRIEHMEENITGNEMPYNDIVEFNNELRNEKKWANSPWTNWFNNQDIASLDYIELED